MKMQRILFLAGCFVMATSTVCLAANEAFFDANSGALHIPTVAVGSTYYSVDMQVTTGLNFDVTEAVLLSAPSDNSIVGSWWAGTNGTGVGEILGITFYPDFTYIHSQNGDEVNDKWVGIEYGTYSINPQTLEFTVQVLFDQNGEVGFSHPKGTMFVSVNGDIMTFSDVGDPDSSTFYRVR